MRKLLLLAAVSAMVCLISVETVSARGRRGCGSSCSSGSSYSSCSSCGGYGSSGCGGYGMAAGSCASCGYAATAPAAACPTCVAGTAPSSPMVVAQTPVESKHATIVVKLPANAQLTIDEAQTTSTSERRVFETPALKTGYEYYYTLKAHIVVDGKTEIVSQRIAVRAGETSTVQMEAPTATVAAR